MFCLVSVFVWGTRTILYRLGMLQQQQGQSDMIHHPQASLQGNTLATRLTAEPQCAGIELQEEVEIWAGRVKVWTCMLLLLYSFKLLVGLSQVHRMHPIVILKLGGAVDGATGTAAYTKCRF